MKLDNRIIICFTVLVHFLSYLHSDVPVVNSVAVVTTDPQVAIQQTEDTFAFVSIIEPWKNAIEKYVQKNNVDFNAKCKKCSEKISSIGEFDGYLLAWITKAISKGHDEFEKIKMLLDKYIKLLSDDAPVEEVIDFMIDALNSTKESCTHCHGQTWEKAASVL